MNTETNNNRLLTIRETMAVLKVGRTKAYGLIGAGVLQVVHFGKRTVRVRAESVERLITNGITQ